MLERSSACPNTLKNLQSVDMINLDCEGLLDVVYPGEGLQPVNLDIGALVELITLVLIRWTSVETSLTLVVRPSTLVVTVEEHEHDSVPLPKI